MEQEKSRHRPITDERAARSSVFSISRTTPSNRFDITARSTGSNVVALASTIVDLHEVVAGTNVRDRSGG